MRKADGHYYLNRSCSNIFMYLSLCVYAEARVSECLSRGVLERKQRNLKWSSIIDSSFSLVDIWINMTRTSDMHDSKDTIPVKNWSHSEKDTLHFSRAPQSNYGEFSSSLALSRALFTHSLMFGWQTQSGKDLSPTRRRSIQWNRARMIGRKSLRNLLSLPRRTNVLDSSRIKRTREKNDACLSFSLSLCLYDDYSINRVRRTMGARSFALTRCSHAVSSS